MALVALLLILSTVIAAVGAVPVGHGGDGGDDARDDKTGEKCVNGEPTQFAEWIINYKIVPPASNTSTTGYIIDPDWMNAHKTGNSVLIDDTYHIYAEAKCQYSCNGTPGCVAYVGYENKATIGDFECYFFEILIEPANIVPRHGPNMDPRELTHAFNKLCNVEAPKENSKD
ncbi:Uncharacterized protein TCAP_06677 [Tolypocladium capitatum]|uniref:Apple domain-containing protein n=1 Tax=Tolypocladium capitatum TaxID=45235 RepID=A0A2K3Q780_9HYPO|nr:Uncharacterized protein TCAP_06677 [Tolypocladium capitatum]